MASILPGFEYDIFISYRHNDNRSGWVSEFVKALEEELAATIKAPVSIYFDTNPHDGLLETHHVVKSLEGKLKCIVFIPVLSHTYCDPKSFAWNNEFLPFCKLSSSDSIGSAITLSNGNVSGRILPIQIHNLNNKDQDLFKSITGQPLRSIDFIFKSKGVNRPLTPQDNRVDNQDKIFYRDQVNKAANAIGQIIESLEFNNNSDHALSDQPSLEISNQDNRSWIWKELARRNIARAALVYVMVAILFHQLLILFTPIVKLEERYVNWISWILIIGFLIAIALAWFYEVSPHGLIRTNSKQSKVNPFPPHQKKPLTSPSLVTLLLLAIVVQYIYFNFLKPPVVHPQEIAGNDIITLAVLPFENRSGQGTDQYIADGITDDIINQLTIISKLKVTNRRRIQQYESKVLSYEEIAKELDVKIILTGSVERRFNEVVVRAQLIDETNTYIWGNTLHRTTENIMALQSEIAQVIVSQLKLKINATEQLRINQTPTQFATAYDYYLRGRSLYYKYQPDANDSAITLFKAAIQIDSNYARAWAGLGDAYSQMNMRFGERESWLDTSMLAGHRAIQLDSNLSEAYKALANAYSYKKLYDKAYPLLVKAVELNPTNEQAVGNLGTNYLLRGDLPQALKWEKKAVGMDPTNAIPYQLTGWIYRWLGDLSNAEYWLQKSLELSNKFYDSYELLAYTYVAQGRKQAALSLVPRVLELGDSRALEVAGLISHYAGNPKNAKTYFQQSIESNPDYKNDPNTVSPIGLGQILLEEGKYVDADVYLTHAMNINRDQITKGSQSYEPRFYIAAIHAIHGNKEEAVEWLRKAYDFNWVDYAHILYGPYFVKIRMDPAMEDLVDLARSKSDALRKEAEEN